MKQLLRLLLVSVIVMTNSSSFFAQSNQIIISNEVMLYSFDNGVSPFRLADYWGGGTSLAVVDGSLALGLRISGTDWQEGGFLTQAVEALDWSAYDVIAMDVYIPQGIEDFTAQIFMKQGLDWAWSVSSNTHLIPGEWVTVEAQLANMGDMTLVNEYGLKIGSDITAFEGTVQIDNIRLINRVEVGTIDGVNASRQLMGFEESLGNWQLADYWHGSRGVALSSAFASDGEQSMALNIMTSGTEWQEGGALLRTGGYNWSAYNVLTLDIYAPEEANNFMAQIFFKIGNDWRWISTREYSLNPNAWTTVVATLTDLGDMTIVQEIGIKIGSDTTVFSGQFYVDNLRLIELNEENTVTAEVFDVLSVIPLTENPSLYNLFELDIEIDAIFNNPYDPLDIRLNAEFRAPDGQIINAPGFYMTDYMTLDDGNVIATGENSWRLRFAPTQIGEWDYRVLVSTLTTYKSSSWASFTVSESDNPGFVRLDSRNPRYFAFDDGTPYFPIGENMAWASEDVIDDYDTWLNALSDNGGNFIRVWMHSWGFGIEWQDTGLGDYSGRQAQAYQLDQVIEMASEKNIYIMLTLLNHGAFSETADSEWNNNPFNVANGGMLVDPIEFATNSEAIRYWNQRLHYIAARYGYSTNIMAWEWWNEVNLTSMSNSIILAPWISRSATYLDNLDPYNHLMTHSGSSVNDSAIWTLDSIDFTQDHLYNMDDLQATFNQVIPQWLENYPDKPFLIGEFGSQHELDEDGLLLHLGLWSAPMNGAAGVGMFWWWDSYIHPNDLYYHFNGISAFFAGEDLATDDWHHSTASPSNPDARVYGLQTDNRALLWVLNQEYTANNYVQTYQDNLDNQVDNPSNVNFNAVENLQVTVEGLAQGVYIIEFWDTISGEIIQTDMVENTSGNIVIVLPTFYTDFAVKIIPST